jgi:hypothetical protein
MGYPNSVGLTQNGLEILRYEYRRTIPKLRNFTPIIIFSFGTEVEVRQLIILLNKNNTVKKTAANEVILHKTFGITE